jgi:hypothetical protein
MSIIGEPNSVPRNQYNDAELAQWMLNSPSRRSKNESKKEVGTNLNGAAPVGEAGTNTSDIVETVFSKNVGTNSENVETNQKTKTKKKEVIVVQAQPDENNRSFLSTLLSKISKIFEDFLHFFQRDVVLTQVADFRPEVTTNVQPVKEKSAEEKAQLEQLQALKDSERKASERNAKLAFVNKNINKFPEVVLNQFFLGVDLELEPQDVKITHLQQRCAETTAAGEADLDVIYDTLIDEVKRAEQD